MTPAQAAESPELEEPLLPLTPAVSQLWKWQMATGKNDNYAFGSVHSRERQRCCRSFLTDSSALFIGVFFKKSVIMGAASFIFLTAQEGSPSTTSAPVSGRMPFA